MGSRVSTASEELFTKLVEWEVLNRQEHDPKALLREVSLTDLSIASSNLDKMGGLGEFISSQMIELEMLYRAGKIDDWRVERDGEKVRLAFDPKPVASFTKLRKTGTALLIALAACTQTMRFREEFVPQAEVRPQYVTASVASVNFMGNSEPVVATAPVKPRRLRKLLNRIIPVSMPQVKPAALKWSSPT